MSSTCNSQASNARVGVTASGQKANRPLDRRFWHSQKPRPSRLLEKAARLNLPLPKDMADILPGATVEFKDGTSLTTSGNPYQEMVW
jgi:hypothetical protein